MAAMSQGDDKLQFPMINNLANEVWKCKEAKLSVDEAPVLGDPERRAILMEAVGAVSYLMAGSNVLIMRHPEAIRMAKAFIDLVSDGGSAADVAGITKQLDDVDIDYASLAPAPDLTVEEEKKAAPKKAAAKKAAPKQVAAKKAAAKPVAAKPAAEKPAAAPAEDPETKAKAEAEAKAKAAADAEAKAVADAQAKADAEVKAAADAEAKAKAEADAKSKAAADDCAKRDAAEDELRQKRAAEREAMAAKRDDAGEEAEVPMTAAAEQKDQVQKILDNLKWVHRRIPLY
jgi:acetyl-CoA decarbonylase/synthase complex subunit delta